MGARFVPWGGRIRNDFHPRRGSNYVRSLYFLKRSEEINNNCKEKVAGGKKGKVKMANPLPVRPDFDDSRNLPLKASGKKRYC